MEDYYYGGSERQKPKQHTPFFVRMIDGVMFVATILAFVVGLITLCAPYVHPSVSWVFPVLGLVAPVVYIVSVLVLLYWIVRWKWRLAACMLVIVVGGLFKVSLYTRMQTRNVYREPSYRGAIDVMSYNVKDFGRRDTPDSVAAIEIIAQYVDSLKPDVACFQEFNIKKYEKSEPKFLEGYNRVNVEHLSIFTKYKILDHGRNLAPTPNRGNGSFWADILVGEDTVRVYNNHLRSTAITAKDDEFLTSKELLFSDGRVDKLKSIAKRLGENSSLRALQVDSIALSMMGSRETMIVCGDFNDPPMSYSYHRLSERLNDAFCEAGVGYPHTFRGFMNLLRIDYILTSKNFEVLSYNIGNEIEGSDHYPVYTHIKLYK